MLVVVLTVAALAVSTLRRHLPQLIVTSGCVVRAVSSVDSVQLTTSQAAISATIAGVARKRLMPERAVTIAYATAMQESHIANLPYGDRDSVGVFQQRPSQGWGTRAELLDPAYASAKFFAALARVPGYQHLAVYQAAQAVQHSADGTAYDQYAGEGAVMASGFTGAQPRAVWCWYGAGISGSANLTAATTELRRVFGPAGTGQTGDGVTLVHASGGTADSVRVRVSRPTAGWALATWLVTHADQYRIRSVGYAGFRWAASAGQRGWTRDASTSQARATASAVAFG